MARFTIHLPPKNKYSPRAGWVRDPAIAKYVAAEKYGPVDTPALAENDWITQPIDVIP